MNMTFLAGLESQLELIKLTHVINKHILIKKNRSHTQRTISSSNFFIENLSNYANNYHCKQVSNLYQITTLISNSVFVTNWSYSATDPQKSN
ncbi:hypothetical protein BpHYR1_015290 [Brachionus plicatilis]|uniref:Uncharacterized protein n=1 Tax=Brachionus plicatilis TaxID=10195 RepID=A0A3M7QQY5_BRAPC|nr:hypothetical protein BpHYR1_015290 [Brachionus plicatilis]